MSINVPLLTPFGKRRGIVDTDAMQEHALWLIKRGITSFWLFGTSGEFLATAAREKARVFIKMVPFLRDHGASVGCGVFSPLGQERKLLAKAARNAGADSLFLMTPIYYPVSDREIVGYYQDAARGVSLPLFAYTYPERAANTLSLQSLGVLLSQKVISGMKDSTGDKERIAMLIPLFDAQGASFLVGGDHILMWARLERAHGAVSALANAFPELVQKSWNGDWVAQSSLMLLRSALSEHGGMPALKYFATRATGIQFKVGEPFLSITKIQQRELDRIFEHSRYDA